MPSKHKIIKAQSQQAVLHNVLIQQTEYRLSLTEVKIILYIISKITPYDKPNEEYTFSIKEFCLACNYKQSDGGNRFDFIRGIMRQLRKKDIIIHPTKDTELITGWFAEAELNKKTNEFTVSFANKVKPYLFHLTQNFTSIWLECVLPMDSIYGILLFMYLSSIKYKGFKHTIEIEELRHLMGCDGKYEQSSDVRKYIIEPAMKDINTYTTLEVDYKFIKTGRKATHIEFNINPNPPDWHKRSFNAQKALGMR